MPAQQLADEASVKMADVKFVNEGAEMDEDHNETIRVLVRVRPAPDGSNSLSVDPAQGLIHLDKGRQSFDVKFDGVFESRASQAEVYEQVQPAIDAAMSGVNSTVLAYGQTGAGKTHTLFGGLLPDDATHVMWFDIGDGSVLPNLYPPHRKWIAQVAAYVHKSHQEG